MDPTKLAEIARKHAQDGDGYGALWIEEGVLAAMTEALAVQTRKPKSYLYEQINALAKLADERGKALAAQERELEELREFSKANQRALDIKIEHEGLLEADNLALRKQVAQFNESRGKQFEYIESLRSHLSQAEADLEHAERNEEEQALTIQILTGKLEEMRKRLTPKIYKACAKHEGQQVWNMKLTGHTTFVETVCPICSGDAT